MPSAKTHLSQEFPDIAHQWHPSKNAPLTPDDVTSGSNKKVWWVCDMGHEWESMVKNATRRGNGCPYCSGKRVLNGFNDLATTCPDAMHLWSPLNSLSPYHVTSGSKKKALWMCEEGHTWEAQIYKVARSGHRCPYCHSSKILSGFNDLETLFPDVSKQWDTEKNSTLPSSVFPHSNKKSWWKCDKGHTWEASPNSRVRGHGCPVCAGKVAHQGDNSLADTHPELVEEWDARKNGNVNPEDIRAGSSFEAHWICKEGHEYKSVVSSRTHPLRKRGCPYCSGRKAIAGVSDMATTHSDMQCFHEDGRKVDMSTISSGSGIFYLWKCKDGHMTYAPAYQAVTWVQGCPQCRNHATSSVEKELACYMKEIVDGEVFLNDRSIIPPCELDIYIPEKNIAIEFNGLYWHTESRGKDKHYHYNKWKMCADQGIQLITIWEDEWRDKQSIVKSMIAHKLGVSREKKVYARKTQVVILQDAKKSREFFNAYHIQGSSSASKYIGLIDDNGDLVALSAWTRNKNTLYLDRFATSCTVVGGMGKLLGKGISLAQELECREIVTFSDHCVSDGGLYETLGFHRDKELSPDYSYVVDGTRRHKFGYRIKRFKEDPSLRYINGMTEKELAKLNGLERIWDCGKTRWVMEV